MDNYVRQDFKLYRRYDEWERRSKGRFHTKHSLTPFQNVKPYVQKLRELKEDKDKCKKIHELFMTYGFDPSEFKSG
jgi:hypothetical protein